MMKRSGRNKVLALHHIETSQATVLMPSSPNLTAFGSEGCFLFKEFTLKYPHQIAIGQHEFAGQSG
jgi:hypothetical protein